MSAGKGAYHKRPHFQGDSRAGPLEKKSGPREDRPPEAGRTRLYLMFGPRSPPGPPRYSPSKGPRIFSRPKAPPVGYRRKCEAPQ